jgi:putative ABC transport system permease protein
MTRGRLVWANLMRHKWRTLLTTASVAVAMFLFATLRSFGTTLDSLSQFGSANRMVVRHATAIVFPLQMSYVQRLAAVPGVTGVSWANWFGGWYQDPKVFFANFAVDGPTFLQLYPEIVVPPEQKEEWLRDRAGAVVGVDLMEKYGWRVGQNVVLNGTIFPGEWQFTIRATYTSTTRAFDQRSFMFHYAYLDERTEHRAQPGWFYLGIAHGDDAPRIAATVDEMFRNSNAPTKTMTEQAFQASWMGMFGNVRTLMNAIGMAVVFAILLVTGNAMMMSARERTGEVAVLKAIGFGNRTVGAIELAEAGAVVLTGTLLGVGSATLLWKNVRIAFIEQFIPGFQVAGDTIWIGAAIAIVLTLVSGLVPAVRASRMNVVTALRTVE